MKTFSRFPFMLGAALGFLAAAALFRIAPLRAQEARAEMLSQEELDRRLDETLDVQKKILERLEAVVTQTQFLKAASGK
ncbi:MAG: hypothetical protein IT578_10820 [Verrucomicrobiae bacterium]|nr:hypothetical protein [Verrucomicrobiae bacterium]